MTQRIDWMRGCATALVTPFKSDGAIDEDALTRLIEYQLAGGVKLLVPCGTTGESATMTEAEDQRVIKRTIELAKGRAHVIAGTGSNSTAATIQNSQDRERPRRRCGPLSSRLFTTSRRSTVCMHTFAQLLKRSICRS